MGYSRAGFDAIVGVDIKPQPRYPFEFVQADALEYVAEHGHEFDAIHASPPCQLWCSLRTMWHASSEHLDLITPTRKVLCQLDKPYVIENVLGAPLIRPIQLCGTIFQLGIGNAELRRHRLFEIVPSFRGTFGTPLRCRHNWSERVIGVYGGHGRDRRRTVGVYGQAGGRSNRDGVKEFSLSERKVAMGIDWMMGDELSQAIPPAYTEFIGRELLKQFG